MCEGTLEANKSSEETAVKCRMKKCAAWGWAHFALRIKYARRGTPRVRQHELWEGNYSIMLPPLAHVLSGDW